MKTYHSVDQIEIININDENHVRFKDMLQAISHGIGRQYCFDTLSPASRDRIVRVMNSKQCDLEVIRNNDSISIVAWRKL